MFTLMYALIGFTSVPVAADVTGTGQFTVETSQGTGRPTDTSQVIGEVKTVGAVMGNALEFGFMGEAGGLPIKVRDKGMIESLTAMKGTDAYGGFDDSANWSAPRLVAAANNSGGVASRPVQGPAPTPSTGPAHQLYIGVRGAVLAIDRTNGQEVWRSPLKGKDFVNVVLEDGDLYAATQGELFCLDLTTGHVRWHTQLKGLGRGLVTIAGNQQTVVVRAKMQQAEEAADSGFLMMMVAMM